MTVVATSASISVGLCRIMSDYVGLCRIMGVGLVGWGWLCRSTKCRGSELSTSSASCRRPPISSWIADGSTPRPTARPVAMLVGNSLLRGIEPDQETWAETEYEACKGTTCSGATLRLSTTPATNCCEKSATLHTSATTSKLRVRVLQLAPVQPLAHSQLYVSTPSIQTPPLLQAPTKQSSILISHMPPAKPLAHVHRKSSPATEQEPLLRHGRCSQLFAGYNRPCATERPAGTAASPAKPPAACWRNAQSSSIAERAAGGW